MIGVFSNQIDYEKLPHKKKKDKFATCIWQKHSIKNLLQKDNMILMYY